MNLASEEHDKEYKVKAAFVYNFLKFIEWSSMDMDDHFNEKDEIILSVLGDNPFGGSLKLLQKKKVQDKRIKILFFSNEELEQNDRLEELFMSHVIFVCKSEKDSCDKIIESFGEKCLLTIGDYSEFASGSGMIAFDLEKGKVRFDINFKNSKDNGVKINVKLLKLARKVYK